MYQQNDLFADDHSIIGQLFDNLDKIPDDEILHKWPRTLTEIIDVMQAELERQGFAETDAKKTSCKLVGVMAHYFGGQSFYLPSGNILKDALRNVMIFKDFKGNNVPELIRKYNLSESHIYAIIREQMALQRKRHQPELNF
ncbi:Mor transcription activator family protein [Pasteurella multocida]|uniref:Mor transcription activator family protein n=1 Tax=Pasteurella multocida TaxID=747 RepID=UPI000352AD6A|nr:Mor transcription activator family protein [Pasteurella multocida]AWW56549.1 transcriptional regulator [Pasteurella multocida]EPE64871.1 Mor transcription activator [Pasteurella multocida P1933]MCL7838027.1 transcriptional regulator [Pasteurella multocida]MCL7843472.1 transcriptional regulator [Pasteurella multocida]MDX3887945.1 Mor transcription activator family protein [Pasteurella multocida]